MRRLSVIAAVVSLLSSVSCAGAADAGDIELPPAAAPFDYQIGEPYEPPNGVRIVARDHRAQPVEGVYNVCYVNAFQAQPGAQGEWDDLLLRDAAGDVVMDNDWDEALLDLRTPGDRERIAATVNRWIDECADKGFQAIEPDNYDSYTRSDGLLEAADAQAYIRLLAEHAHERGLAIGQKNTTELAGAGEENGLDFAVVEECGHYGECGEFVAAFGEHVLAVEYTAEGMAEACAAWKSQLSLVRRDLQCRLRTVPHTSTPPAEHAFTEAVRRIVRPSAPDIQPPLEWGAQR